jgi:hypothetical protein
MFWGKENEKNECVRNILVFMRGRCCSWKRCVQTRAWKEVVCSKYLKWNSWKDFHDKAFGFLFKIIVPLKSIIRFVSNLK